MRHTLALIAISAALAAIVGPLYIRGLDRAPVYLVRDEVQSGRQAYSLRTTGRDLMGRRLPLYFAEPGYSIGRDPVMIYATGLVLRVMPLTERSVRLVSALVGTLNVVLMFFVARRAFGSNALGVCAAGMLALAPAHFIHSRLGVSLIYPLPFVLGWLLGLTAYLENPERRWPLVAGLASLALGIYSYLACVVLVPVFVLLTGFAIYTRETWRRSLAAFGGFALMLLPFLAWELVHPRYGEFVRTYHPYAERFTPLQGLKDMLSHFGFSTRVSAYWFNLNPGMLFLTGDSSYINSTRETGAFLWPVGILMVIGAYQIIATRRSRLGMLLILAFLAAPLPAAITAEVSVRRELVMLVFGTLIATFGLEWLVASGQRGVWRAAGVVLLLLMPFQFRAFHTDYMTENRIRTSLWFGGNIRGAFEDVINRRREAPVGPVYLSTRIPYVDEYWGFYRLKQHAEAMAVPVYFDPAKLDPEQPPAGTLLVSTAGEAPAPELLLQHGWRQVFNATEPNGASTYLVFEKSLSPGQPARP